MGIKGMRLHHLLLRLPRRSGVSVYDESALFFKIVGNNPRSVRESCPSCNLSFLYLVCVFHPSPSRLASLPTHRHRLFFSPLSYTTGLMKLISDNAPAAIKEKEMKHFTGRKVAVDASMSLYQFLVSAILDSPLPHPSFSPSASYFLPLPTPTIIELSITNTHDSRILFVLRCPIIVVAGVLCHSIRLVVSYQI